MESEMELVEGFDLDEKPVEDIYEPSISVEDTVFEASTSDSFDDTYNLNLSVAVVETESDEVDSEFIEAITEIEGKKSFPCPKCTKVCKSKIGLTRHTNSKHRVDSASSSTTAKSSEHGEQETRFSEDNLASIVEAIKTKLIKDDLFGPDINAALKEVSSSKALFDAVLPIYNKSCRKKNQDKMLEDFYGLLPINPSTFLHCTDGNVANLIMIEIPDRLVGFFKIANSREEARNNPTQPESKTIELDPSERGPLSYIGGYIVSKMHQKSRNKNNTGSEELQTLVRSLKSTECANNFISARSRGGLVTPCDGLLGILEEAEISFRKHVGCGDLTMRNIPTDMICASTLNCPLVKSLWDNIVLDSGVEQSCSTQKLLLENIVKLYLRVRSFSYARDYISKYKIKAKQTKSKALRKDLKRSKDL